MWEFVYFVGVNRVDEFVVEYGFGRKYVIFGGGVMYGSNGMNEYNVRCCYLMFVCFMWGVIYGLVGYFELMFYES